MVLWLGGLFRCADKNMRCKIALYWNVAAHRASRSLRLYKPLVAIPGKRHKAALAERCQDCFRNSTYVEFKRESKKYAGFTLRHDSRPPDKKAAGLLPDK